LLYGRAGKAHETKKNIFKWNGLANKAENKEKFTEKLSGWKIVDLRALNKILCLASASQKEDLIKIASSFLVVPKLAKLEQREKTARKKRSKRTPIKGKSTRRSRSTDTSESEKIRSF